MLPCAPTSFLPKTLHHGQPGLFPCHPFLEARLARMWRSVYFKDQCPAVNVSGCDLNGKTSSFCCISVQCVASRASTFCKDQMGKGIEVISQQISTDWPIIWRILNCSKSGAHHSNFAILQGPDTVSTNAFDSHKLKFSKLPLNRATSAMRSFN